LRSHPDHAALKFALGLCLSALGRFEQARSELAAAQVINPNVAATFLQRFRNRALPDRFNLEPVLIYLDARYQEQSCCYWHYRRLYIDMLKQAIHGADTAYLTINNLEFGFQSFSLDLDAGSRLRLADNIGEQVMDVAWNLGQQPFKFERQEKTRLRIGYVSPDFRRHPTGYLTRKMYALHDRQKFEIYGYSLVDTDVDDPVYRSISAGCDVFRNVAKLGSLELAKLIYEDQLDILVDLAGYTTFSRPEVIAQKPAPVQISYVGYMESQGRGFIDYVITDIHVYPNGKSSYWHEAPIRMPHHVLPYDDEVDNAPTSARREDYGLPADAFVFCCFNNNYKIEPVIYDTWANILKAVPNGVLWLFEKNTQVRLNLVREAEARGLNADRLIFAPFISDNKQHLLRYQLADIFLDTLWHNAHTTALEALWQGLPILTRQGDVVSARVASSCLQVLGLPDLIAHDIAEYEQRAIHYAHHPEQLAVLRDKLKTARYTSGLFNTALTVKHLEYAYQTIWRRYMDGHLPQGFDVPDLSQS
jgi:predicted O-linked N-acetylglucosamine transferase (SPINDLY family)